MVERQPGTSRYLPQFVPLGCDTSSSGREEDGKRNVWRKVLSASDSAARMRKGFHYAARGDGMTSQSPSSRQAGPRGQPPASQTRLAYFLRTMARRYGSPSWASDYAGGCSNQARPSGILMAMACGELSLAAGDGAT